MTDAGLKPVLPHFVAVFLLVAFWRSWQDKNILLTAAVKTDPAVSRLQKAEHFFSVLLVLFSLMTLLHACYPHLYLFLLPLDVLNEPAINGIGVILLRIALAWVVVAQLFIRRAVSRLNQTKNPSPFLQAKKSHLFGMLLMFAGMLVALTNVAGIVLCNLAFLIFRTCGPDKQAG